MESRQTFLDCFVLGPRPPVRGASAGDRCPSRRGGGVIHIRYCQISYTWRDRPRRSQGGQYSVLPTLWLHIERAVYGPEVSGTSTRAFDGATVIIFGLFISLPSSTRSRCFLQGESQVHPYLRFPDVVCLEGFFTQQLRSKRDLPPPWLYFEPAISGAEESGPKTRLSTGRRRAILDCFLLLFERLLRSIYAGDTLPSRQRSSNVMRVLRTRNFGSRSKRTRHESYRQDSAKRS